MRRAGLAVGAGQALVLTIGLLVVATAPLLGFPPRAAPVLTILGPAIVVFLVVSAWLPWSRWAPAATLAFPLAGLSALAVLGLSAEGIAFAYVGVIPLCFVYVGIFHGIAAGATLVPIAWAAYVAMLESFDSSVVVRLAIYGVAWFATSAVLSVLVARQRTVTEGLRSEAFTDELTRLGNRRGLEARMLELAAGDSVVICDLDLFKSINDAFGHAAGDEVLRNFGAMVDEHLRRRDYAARYGGEEFVLIFVRTDPAQALAALASLRTEWLELDAGVTFSAGVAMVTATLTASAVLDAADAALYEAKAAGRDRFRVAASNLRG